MKTRSILVIGVMLVLSSAANAQIGNILNKTKQKPKQDQTQKPATEDADKAAVPASTPPARSDGYKDTDFLYMGRNDMNGQSIAGMRACVVYGSDQNPPPVSKAFTAWINISETAALRSFNSSTCPVVAFYLYEHPAHKYKNIDSLTETAQGNSIYKVEAGKLVLVRKVEASQFYVVVVPDHNKPGLKLADLRLCGYPDTIKLFRRKVNTVVNCHDQKQKLYVFEQYKSYPGPMQTSSVLFDAAEFSELNKQGKFKGLVIYKLVGEDLTPFK